MTDHLLLLLKQAVVEFRLTCWFLKGHLPGVNTLCNFILLSDIVEFLVTITWLIPEFLQITPNLHMLNSKTQPYNALIRFCHPHMNMQIRCILHKRWEYTCYRYQILIDWVALGKQGNVFGSVSGPSICHGPSICPSVYVFVLGIPLFKRSAAHQLLNKSEGWTKVQGQAIQGQRTQTEE